MAFSLFIAFLYLSLYYFSCFVCFVFDKKFMWLMSPLYFFHCVSLFPIFQPYPTNFLCQRKQCVLKILSCKTGSGQDVFDLGILFEKSISFQHHKICKYKIDLVTPYIVALFYCNKGLLVVYLSSQLQTKKALRRGPIKISE